MVNFSSTTAPTRDVDDLPARSIPLTRPDPTPIHPSPPVSTPAEREPGWPDHPGVAPTDAALIRAHLRDDPQAFGEIARRHRAQLWAVALRVLGNHHDAQDAVQNALLQAFRSAESWRGDHDCGPWLRTIVENSSKNIVRARDRRGHETSVAPDNHALTDQRPSASPEQIAGDRLDATEAFNLIPEAYRSTFVLVKLRGLSYAEAAEVEDVPIGTVRSRINRAVAVLAPNRKSYWPGGNL